MVSMIVRESFRRVEMAYVKEEGVWSTDNDMVVESGEVEGESPGLDKRLLVLLRRG